MAIFRTLLALGAMVVTAFAIDCPTEANACGVICCSIGAEICILSNGSDSCVAVPKPAVPYYKGPAIAPPASSTNASVSFVPITTSVVFTSSALVSNSTSLIPANGTANSTATITSTVVSASTNMTTTATSTKTPSHSTSEVKPSSSGGAVASLIPAGAVGLVMAAVLGAS